MPASVSNAAIAATMTARQAESMPRRPSRSATRATTPHSMIVATAAMTGVVSGEIRNDQSALPKANTVTASAKPASSPYTLFNRAQAGTAAATS
ncbi:hypothetical protein ML5_5960 [Micromonospora sp. L5]|nr:hypothetical protein ML5_5960 [Micromonospora sp. L5]